MLLELIFLYINHGQRLTVDDATIGERKNNIQIGIWQKWHGPEYVLDDRGDDS